MDVPVVQVALGAVDPGESTHGEAWLMVIEGLLVWWDSPGAAAGGVNKEVGLRAELLVLWKGREPGLSGMAPTNPVCTLTSCVGPLVCSQHWHVLLASRAC